MKIVDLDRQIVAMLLEDARRPNASIARDLGVSEATVRRRVNMMIDDSVLTVKAVPDAGRLGLGTSALIGIDVEPSLGEAVAASLESRQEVVFLGVCAGRYDLLVRVLLTDLPELKSFLEDYLARLPGIRKTETLILLNMKKEWRGA